MNFQPGIDSSPSSAVGPRVLATALVLTLILTPGAGTAPQSGTSPHLEEQLSTILDAPAARSALWGIQVIDVATGDVLYDLNGDKRFVPASNLKLLTTGAALDALSGEYRFQTVLFLRGRIDDDGTIAGDLILRGSGDPSFGSIRYRDDPLREWAGSLAAMGVKRVEGRIIGDDNIYEDDPYPEGWDIRMIVSQTYATSVGGLAYRDNIADMFMRGGASGTPVQVSFVPAAHIEVDNAAWSGQGRGVRLIRPPGTDHVRLEGGLPAGGRRHVRLPVSNPTRFALTAFASHLEEAGIQVDATLEDRDEMASFPGYRGASPLFAHLSPPLSTLVRLVNKTSNNFYAEQILRAINDQGDARSAERQIRELVTKAGASSIGLSITDGSGLSRKNLVTPESIARVLAYMFTHPQWDAYSASLPRGGEPGTTLAGRLSGVPVQAKTGSLEFSRALSGYVYTRNNKVLAFSAIANNYASSGSSITNTLDAIARTLASYSGD